jgi:hypothetical protein
VDLAAHECVDIENTQLPVFLFRYGFEFLCQSLQPFNLTSDDGITRDQ